MNFWEFLFEKLNMVLVNLFAATALIVFLKLVGIQGGALGLILIVWGIILIAVVLPLFHPRRRSSALMRYSLPASACLKD